MADTDSEGLGLEDPDHLPWLETADDYEYDDSPSIFKIILFILLGLSILAAAFGVYYWYQNKSDNGGVRGNGDVIAAQEGNYKVAPEDEQGKDFEGEGDASFATSEGQKVNGKIGSEAKVDSVKTDSPLAAGTAAVQLGAYSDTESAAAGWTSLSRRFGFLKDDMRKIVEGKIDNGATIYRLQAVASNAAQANDICSKLKAAGENCLVVK